MDCSQGVLWLVWAPSLGMLLLQALPVLPRVGAMRFNWEAQQCLLCRECRFGVTQKAHQAALSCPVVFGKREGRSPFRWGRSKPGSSRPSLCWREEWVLSLGRDLGVIIELAV